MFNELDRLQECSELLQLLQHYGELGAADKQAWLDRRMQLEGCDARTLSRLHGELIAYGWLEQNTGNTPVLRIEEAPMCYRVTSAGFRTIKSLRSEVAS